MRSCAGTKAQAGSLDERYWTSITDELIALALAEDIGGGDLTTDSLIDPHIVGKGEIISREPIVVCGQCVAGRVFNKVDRELTYEALRKDGELVKSGEVIASVKGFVASILKAERVSLNFLQRLSGISTYTNSVVNFIKGTSVVIKDTRKTTPGLRELEKYAVKVGGGENHRMGLYDAVLIKNNHVDIYGGDIFGAVSKCRKNAPGGTKIQVEVRSLDELKLALFASPDSILLDNMTPENVREAVNLIRKHPIGKKLEIEASGGIDLGNIRDYCIPGLDCISLGSLTHSFRSADICLHIT